MWKVLRPLLSTSRPLLSTSLSLHNIRNSYNGTPLLRYWNTPRTDGVNDVETMQPHARPMWKALLFFVSMVIQCHGSGEAIAAENDEKYTLKQWNQAEKGINFKCNLFESDSPLTNPPGAAALATELTKVEFWMQKSGEDVHSAVRLVFRYDESSEIHVVAEVFAAAMNGKVIFHQFLKYDHDNDPLPRYLDTRQHGSSQWTKVYEKIPPVMISYNEAFEKLKECNDKYEGTRYEEITINSEDQVMWKNDCNCYAIEAFADMTESSVHDIQTNPAILKPIQAAVIGRRKFMAEVHRRLNRARRIN
eukprot:112927_1